MDKRVCLKVKIKSLAAESKIIRIEEKKARGDRIRNELTDHRKGIVRYEARHTHLAYGFLRGRKYEQIEPKAKEKPDWKKVRKMVERYGACMDYGNESWDEFDRRREEQLKRFEEWSKTGPNGIIAKLKRAISG